jgi:hypothetical protein
MGVNCPMVCQNANFVGHSNNGFHPNQGFHSGWNKPSFPFDNLAGGTFFMLNTKEVRALFVELSASERESEEHGLKENSRTVEIDPLTRKFQGMALTQPAASETHQAQQEILAQPSYRKKMPMSRISSDAILNKRQNRLSRPALPTVPCILVPFKVHHALCDWGANINIFPKMVNDSLDEDPLVPTPSSIATGSLRYNVALRDSKGCVD